ncbi:alpha/beta hydrolase [Xanthocytophaga agilis]|uniref:Alpha/beta hydrolase n=1 Tax=Xanthocytophaga agilis TaxID=3048010 RepID=A0AAE3R0Y0_9BACT|nr:alpha/beta hydrolase [Xanthocytophaga agilis]MDJ1499617.1 alpha/beta hydrolase [Xanthocytophaga agilis]
MIALSRICLQRKILPVIPLAIADGRQAITYVRRHAEVYKIAVDRIGIMGFSAGGLVAAATAFEYTAENRPDFVVPVYADLPEWIQDPMLPSAPPLFLACTQDDEFGFVTHALKLYTKWYTAQRPVEMHLYTKGGHGFGVGNIVDTTYQWLDQLSRLLAVLGM